jgi:hypothetical protein
MKYPLPPKDRNGRKLRVGDRVRVVGVPDLSGMSKQGVAESLPVFQYLVGKYKRIAAFDEYGCVQLNFFIASGKLKGWHGVGIEPYLLHVPQRRSTISVNPDALKRAGYFNQ